jgi:hypothetical protein
LNFPEINCIIAFKIVGYNHQSDKLPGYGDNYNQVFTTSKPIFNFESKPSYQQTTLSQTFDDSPNNVILTPLTPSQNLFFNNNPFQSQKPSYKPTPSDGVKTQVPRQAVSEIVKKMNTLEEMEKATSVQLQQQVESLKKLEQMNNMIKVEKLTQEQQLEQVMKAAAIQEKELQMQQQQLLLEKLKQQDLLRQIEEKTRVENLKQQEMLTKMKQFEQVKILEEMKQTLPPLPTEVDLNKQKRELQQQIQHLQLLEQMNQLKHIEELEKQHKFVEQKLMQQIKVSSPEILQFAMNISKRKKRK